MTTKTLPSCAPLHAIRVWSDGLTLFAEIPGSPSYVMRFSHTESALTKVLSLLKQRFADAPRGSHKLAEFPITRATGAKVTEGQREAARDVLKKLGMLG